MRWLAASPICSEAWTEAFDNTAGRGAQGRGELRHGNPPNPLEGLGGHRPCRWLHNIMKHERVFHTLIEPCHSAPRKFFELIVYSV